jgi:hypothetical protein
MAEFRIYDPCNLDRRNETISGIPRTGIYRFPVGNVCDDELRMKCNWCGHTPGGVRTEMCNGCDL